MGIILKYTLPHPSGRVSFRRPYPAELRAFLPGKFELKRSLGRADDPEFSVRYNEALLEYGAVVDRARREKEGRFDALDAPTIAYLAELYRVEALEGDDYERWSGEAHGLLRSIGAQLDALPNGGWRNWQGRDASRWAAKTRATLEDALNGYRVLRGSGDLDGIEEEWAEEAWDFLEARGLLIQHTARDPFRQLCRALNDASIKALEARLARLDGEEVPTPPEPERPVSAAGKPKSGLLPEVPLLATFDAYATAQGVKANVRYEWRRALEALVAHLGHDDAARISVQDVQGWRDKLAGETTRKGELRSPRTVRNKYLTPLRAALAWAVEEHRLSANVAAQVTIRVPRRSKLRDPDFTTDEATRILTAALKPVSDRFTPEAALARRWVPWICAYTGARVNEVTQLRAEDVAEVDGIWTIRITPEAGTVKTGEARTVPLHPHLIEQGFPAIAKATVAGPLFYNPGRKRTVGGGANRHFKKAGERLAAWVRAEVGINDPSLQPNHAWRHTFKTRARAAGIEERVHDAITGHAPRSTGQGYGSVSVGLMHEAIVRLPRFEVVVSLA